MKNDLLISRVLARKYYGIHIKLASPLNVSNGESRETDSDVLLDADDVPFVPGTSIAGAFRNALMQEKNQPGIMGFSDGEKGRMSQIFISDLILHNARIITRDGVKLENKTVIPGAKYDMQAVETGADGWIFLEVVFRENDTETEEDIVAQIDSLICHLDSGDIRFGSKKNRGYGEIRVTEVAEHLFRFDGKPESVENWISFLHADGTIRGFHDSDITEMNAWKKSKDSVPELNTEYVRIRIPLKLEGGISIRKYSTRPNEADFEHITIQGEDKKPIPVIPGTSWNGAIRGDALRILKEDFHVPNAEKWIGMMFGPIVNNRKDSESIWQSRVGVSESRIDGAVELPMTRTAIDRFSASAKSGSLYSGLSYFGGTTDLNLRIRKGQIIDKDTKEKISHLEIVGLLDLVIQDIMNGFVAIGGQTSIGRGIFSGKTSQIQCEGCRIEDCRKALAEFIFGSKEGDVS